MAVEQDHRRLNKIVESKIAIDAEASDFRENESNLDSFVISGLPLIQDLTGKPWQDRAVKDVQGFIKKLMGKSFPIVFVSNSTKRHKDAPVEYTIRMREVADREPGQEAGSHETLFCSEPGYTRDQDSNPHPSGSRQALQGSQPGCQGSGSGIRSQAPHEDHSTCRGFRLPSEGLQLH